MPTERPTAQCDGDSGRLDVRPERWRLIELRQTGGCEQAQADGIPCPSPGCSCESCRRSLLHVGRLC